MDSSGLCPQLPLISEKAPPSQVTTWNWSPPDWLSGLHRWTPGHSTLPLLQCLCACPWVGFVFSLPACPWQALCLGLMGWLGGASQTDFLELVIRQGDLCVSSAVM